MIKITLLAASLLVGSACASCKSPGEFGPGPWLGLPFGGGQPAEPEDGKVALAVEVFYVAPACAGSGYIAGNGPGFAYESVRVGPRCFDESGVGFGFLVQP